MALVPLPSIGRTRRAQGELAVIARVHAVTRRAIARALRLPAAQCFSAPARSASCVKSNSYAGQDGAAFVLDTGAFEDEAARGSEKVCAVLVKRVG